MSTALMLDAVEKPRVHRPAGFNASRGMQLARTPRIRDETQRRVRDWIASLPELTGKSLTKIAEEAEIAVTTLTKPANNPDHPHVTSTLTIAKIVEKHRVKPPLGFEHLAGAPAGFGEREATPFRYDAPPDINALVKDFVADRPGVDPWTLRTRAIELFGYMPGDVVILDLNAEWYPAAIVCAQWFNRATGRDETIWRRYDPPYLITATTDASLTKTIHEDAVGRKGAVIMAFRVPARPA